MAAPSRPSSWTPHDAMTGFQRRTMPAVVDTAASVESGHVRACQDARMESNLSAFTQPGNDGAEFLRVIG